MSRIYSLVIFALCLVLAQGQSCTCPVRGVCNKIEQASAVVMASVETVRQNPVTLAGEFVLKPLRVFKYTGTQPIPDRITVQVSRLCSITAVKQRDTIILGMMVLPNGAFMTSACELFRQSYLLSKDDLTALATCR